MANRRSYGSKSVLVAYFWLFFSVTLICGMQHFYLGKPVKGVIYLFTFGLLGIGLIWDLFTLPMQVAKA